MSDLDTESGIIVDLLGAAEEEPAPEPAQVVVAEPNEKALTGSDRDRLVEVLTDAIVEDAPGQTRGYGKEDGKYFDPVNDPEDKALVESLQLMGQRQPVTLEVIEGRRDPRWPGQPVFRTIAGHRRVAALRYMGRDRVLAMVRKPETARARDLDTLIENIQKPLSPLQMALTINRFVKVHGMKYEDVTQYSGRSVRTMKRYTRLLKAPPELQELMDREDLQIRVMDLIMAAPPAWQLDLILVAVANGLTQTEMEELVAEAERSKKSIRKLALARKLAMPSMSELSRPASDNGQALAPDGDSATATIPGTATPLPTDGAQPNKAYRRGQYGRRRKMKPERKQLVLKEYGLKMPADKLATSDLDEHGLRVAALLVKGGLNAEKALRLLSNDQAPARRAKRAMAQLDAALRNVEGTLGKGEGTEFGVGLGDLAARLSRLNRKLNPK